MRYLIFFLVVVVFLFAACQKPTPLQNSSAYAKRYPFKGKVISVDKAAKKAKIEHEDIPGYMPAMTMDFPIREDWVWGDLVAGSEIKADLVVDNVKGEYWLEKIGISAAPNPNQPPVPVNENFAPIGRDAPNFSLTNQDGKHITLTDFRGRALAITFIYAKCPLPDYCVRMSTNFSDLANQIKNNAELKDRIRLLSISFDPANDTPEKLRAYGLGYLGKDVKADFSVWQLAVGTDKEVRRLADFFGLQYEVDQNDKTQINHSLRTVVISPDGKVTRIFPGNEWTPNDLLKELSATLAPAK